jgi:hypothetical protein
MDETSIEACALVPKILNLSNSPTFLEQQILGEGEYIFPYIRSKDEVLRVLYVDDGKLTLGNFRTFINLKNSEDDFRRLNIEKIYQSFVHFSSKKKVFFCDTKGNKVYSNFTKLEYTNAVQLLLPFLNPQSKLLLPIKNDCLKLEAAFRIVAIKQSEVTTHDCFGNSLLFDSYIQKHSSESFLMYDQDGYLCHAYMTEDDCQVLKKYIEDHEF